MLAYVEPQLSVFDWPDPELLVRLRSAHAWSRLSPENDVAKRVFLVPSHTDSRFLPPGCEVAFAQYHFMRRVGVSEARAESVASLMATHCPLAIMTATHCTTDLSWERGEQCHAYSKVARCSPGACFSSFSSQTSETHRGSTWRALRDPLTTCGQTQQPLTRERGSPADFGAYDSQRAVLCALDLGAQRVPFVALLLQVVWLPIAGSWR